jgi:hypothetical protein
MARILLALVLLLLFMLPDTATSAATYTWLKGNVDTWVSNNTNLASGSKILSAAITPSNANYTHTDCELNIPALSGTPAANTAVVMWILGRSDGTNYEDGDATNDSARAPDVVFPVRAVTGAQRIQIRKVELPRDLFKVVVKNDGTGVSMNGATTIWTVKCTNFIMQSP